MEVNFGQDKDYILSPLKTQNCFSLGILSVKDCKISKYRTEYVFG